MFRNAETILEQLLQTSCTANAKTRNETPSFKTLYMIGDNPPVDIKGAQLVLLPLSPSPSPSLTLFLAPQAGYPWFSILTRTGVFRQRENHTQYPADMVLHIPLSFTIITPCNSISLDVRSIQMKLNFAGSRYRGRCSGVYSEEGGCVGIFLHEFTRIYSYFF